MKREHCSRQLGRRAFMANGALVIAAVGTTFRSALAHEAAQLRAALVTDLHYADKASVGSRHYRETLGKFQEAAAQFHDDQPHFVVELGDLIDAADSVETELKYLDTINREYAAVCKDRHYVLGNHCVDTLHKGEFLDSVGQERSYYSFDREGFHFIVLDACFRSDGEPYGRKNFTWTDANIPPHELKWLEADLKATDLQTVVFTHQRLDETRSHSVKNNAAVRQLLEAASHKVLAVFQGHSHQNALQEIGGIHYCTLVAMVEGSGRQNSGYSSLNIAVDGTIRLNGFRQQNNYRWPAPSTS